jgi:HSP20 family protein
MALIRWDPFSDLLSIQDKMNRLFEDSLTRTRTFGPDEEIGVSSWTPAVVILVNEKEIFIKREDVQINIENNVLTLSGERKLEKETKKENYHRIERSYGVFKRSFTLPTVVDQDNIKATFVDGVLQMTMAKREESKPRQIEIQSK